MSKILAGKLSEVTQAKHISVSEIQSATSIPASKIYNNDLDDNDINRIAEFLAVKPTFLTTTRMTYSDRQDLKSPINWSVTIPKGIKLKKDGTPDHRGGARKGYVRHFKGYVKNCLDKEMVKGLSKEAGFTVNSLGYCIGYNLSYILSDRYQCNVSLDCIENICYFLDCKPEDIYDGEISIDEPPQRKLSKKDKYHIKISKNNLSAKTLEALEKKSSIPKSFLIYFFSGVKIRKDLVLYLFSCYNAVLKNTGKAAISQLDFCNYTSIKTDKQIAKEEEKKIKEIVKKTENNKVLDEKPKTNEQPIINNDTSIKRSFINIIPTLSNNEILAFQKLLESEKENREAKEALSKYL